MRRPVRLRPATPEDARRLWEWRNEEGTRAASFSSEPIPYGDHLSWFERTVDDPHSRLWIAVDPEDQPVGCARLDLMGDDVEINLSIAKEHRGRGVGTGVIRAATEVAIGELDARRVLAHVKADNQESLGAFRAAGFEVVGPRTIAGIESVEVAWEAKQ